MKALTVIADRLFIADEVRKLEVAVHWRKAMLGIKRNGDTSAFAAAVGKIIADITESAKHIIG